MTNTSYLFLVCITIFAGNTDGTAEICRGPHCLVEHVKPCFGSHCLGRADSTSHYLSSSSSDSSLPINYDYQNYETNSPPRSPFTIIHPHHTGFGGSRENARTITAEVSSSRCTGRNCHASSKLGRDDTRDCKGIECRLPHRIRQKPKHVSCTGEECLSVANVGGSGPALVHMQDRAAQVLGEFSEFGHLAAERGGPPLGIQLTCDVKPGSGEAPSEDALVLQLHLAKGQEKLVEELRGQQAEIQQLQSRLTEQQSALLAQQQEILEQQRRMFQQMEEVKDQYGQLLVGVKHMSVQAAQGDMEGHLDALRGQARTHTKEASYAVHKVDMEASVMEVGRVPLGCGSCGGDEYCDLRGERPSCERCTVCPPGFFLVSQCSIHSDRICQDRDECLEIPNICGEQDQCLNTPGGFRCLAMKEKEGAAGICGHAYFYNTELEECQACSECDGQPVATPCSAMTDTVCSYPSEGGLSFSWSGDATLPEVQEFPIVPLRIQGSADGSLLSLVDGRVMLQQHGLVWADHNLALRHGCRSFIQASLRLNITDGEGRDLSGVRMEQQEGKSLQSASISGSAAMEPGHMLSLLVRSASHQCSHSEERLRLHPSLVSPFSLLWLSHDTGAVALTAQAVAAAHYHTNYRPAFRTSSVSDPYVVGLTHDGRGVRFAEGGTVKFVLQQALYSMGQACTTEGYYLLAYVNRNGSSAELARVFKSGVHYRDTSISMTTATTVSAGDMLSFEILAPAQCNIRYFGDDSGISMLSLLWIPSAVSASLSASVSAKGLPSGAVRNKALLFRQTSPGVTQMELAGVREQHPNRDFIFSEAGSVSLALDLRLIHSCGLVKLTLHLSHGRPDGAQTTVVAQQARGQMPEGSEWDSVGLRVSFQVQNGTAVFSTVDCMRGRINQIAEAGSGISILWVAA